MRGMMPNCEISVSSSIRQISTFRGANTWASPVLSRLSSSELARKTTPETMPIQCRIPNDRPTIDPASCRVGSTEKAVCATTGKNISPPSQTIKREQHEKPKKRHAGRL